jgi:SAM-dependent methyltransferase
MSDPQSNIEVAQRAFVAAVNGDWSTVRTLVHGDVTWHIPGNSPIAGDTIGIDGFVAKVQMLITSGLNVELLNVFASGDQVVTLQRNTAPSNLGGLDILVVNLFTLTEGKLTRMQTFPSDLYALDRFWSGQKTPRSLQPRRQEEFDTYYTSTPAWDIGRPQPALVALRDAGAFRGRVLDVGCGTGEHAILAAERGLVATGIDGSAAAIAQAREKAERRGSGARFVVGDATGLEELGQQWDTVIDTGLFHVFDDDDRARFVESLSAIVPSGGRYFLLCFSDDQPGTVGPRRVSKAELRAAFEANWRIDSIEPARFELTILPDGASAWLACLTRTEQ